MDDYPAELRNAPPDSLGDGRGYQNRECTSAVAWWAHLAGVELDDYGNASNWPKAAAGRAGYVVDSRPEVGAVAVFGPGVAGAGRFGHVAYVVAVERGYVTVQDYNYTGNHLYAMHAVNPVGLVFIHLPPRPTPAEDDDVLAAVTVARDGVQRFYWRDPASGHLFEKFYDGTMHGPSDLSAVFGAPSVAGGGSATTTEPDASGGYQVIVAYWSAAGFVEMFYVSAGPELGWHGPVIISEAA